MSGVDRLGIGASSLRHDKSFDYDSTHFTKAMQKRKSEFHPIKPPEIALPLFLHKETKEGEESFLLHNFEDLILTEELLQELTLDSKKNLFLLICYKGDNKSLEFFHKGGYLAVLEKDNKETIKIGILETIKTDNASFFQQLIEFLSDTHSNNWNVYQFSDAAIKENATNILNAMAESFGL